MPYTPSEGFLKLHIKSPPMNKNKWVTDTDRVATGTKFAYVILFPGAFSCRIITSRCGDKSESRQDCLYWRGGVVR